MEGAPGLMLVELSVVEQRYHAVMELLAAGVPVVEVAERYGVCGDQRIDDMSPEMAVELSLDPNHDGAADTGQPRLRRPAGIGPPRPAWNTSTCPATYREPVLLPVRFKIPATAPVRERQRYLQRDLNRSGETASTTQRETGLC